jgi:hypothetical protein
MNLCDGIGVSTMAENQHDEESVEFEELPALGLSQLRTTREITGKRVRSIYISYTDSYNVAEVDFVDGTSLSVELFPMVELKAESNDWKVENGKVVKSCPRMIAR